MVTKDELNELQDYFDNIYVRQTTCSEKQETVNKRFANDDKRIDRILDKFAMWDKLLWVIASTAVGGLVTAILNLVIK